MSSNISFIKKTLPVEKKKSEQVTKTTKITIKKKPLPVEIQDPELVEEEIDDNEQREPVDDTVTTHNEMSSDIHITSKSNISISKRKHEDEQSGSEEDEGDEQSGSEGDEQSGSEEDEGDEQSGSEEDEGDEQSGSEEDEGDEQSGSEGDEGDEQSGSEEDEGDEQSGSEEDEQSGSEGDEQSGSEEDEQSGSEGEEDERSSSNDTDQHIAKIGSMVREILQDVYTNNNLDEIRQGISEIKAQIKMLSEKLDSRNSCESHGGIEVIKCSNTEPVNNIQDIEKVKDVKDKTKEVEKVKDVKDKTKEVEKVEEPIVETTKSVDPLAKMIDNISDSNGALNSIMVNYNKTFDANFILNLNGNSREMASNMKKRGFHNCLIMNLDLPDKISKRLQFAYYMKDIIKIAKERKYKVINIFTDNIKIHKEFSYIVNYLKLAENLGWTLLQYYCTRHQYQNKLNKFDATYYMNANPDLVEKSVNDKRRAQNHWKSKGMRGDRIGMAEIVNTKSDDYLAFALNIEGENYELINQTITKAIKNNTPVITELVSKVNTKMVKPNLFVDTSLMGSKISKSLKIVNQLYEVI
jgi:hypothetical protein